VTAAPRSRPKPARRGGPGSRRPGRTLARGGLARIVLATVPDEATGRKVARALVEERLAACGSVVPIAASVYRWEGRVREEPECLLVLKTRAGRVARLTARLLDLHPDEVPEILVIAVDSGLRPYLAWVRAETAD